MVRFTFSTTTNVIDYFYISHLALCISHPIIIRIRIESSRKEKTLKNELEIGDNWQSMCIWILGSARILSFLIFKKRKQSPLWKIFLKISILFSVNRILLNLPFKKIYKRMRTYYKSIVSWIFPSFILHNKYIHCSLLWCIWCYCYHCTLGSYSLRDRYMHWRFVSFYIKVGSMFN